MVGGADLHMHSVWSDGSWTPDRLAKAARRARLAAVALTDHDTVAGFEEMQAAGGERGIRVISGAEISTWFDTDLHLLALGFEPEAPVLRGVLDRLRESRRGRAERMVERLGELGMPISFEVVLENAGNAAIGRPHVARALLDSGWVGSNREAFDLWLGDGKPACVDKLRVTPAEAIEAVHEAGGICVAAHPGIYGGPDFFDPLIEAGLDGFEVRHPLHGRKAEAAFDEYAVARGLLRTGGSDFHGPAGPIEVGGVAAPPEWLEELDDGIARRRSSRPSSPVDAGPGKD